MFMTKNPNAKTPKVKKFVFSGENPPDIGDTSPRALIKFIRDNMSKFRDTGDCIKHKGGNGRPKTATNKKVTL